MFEPLYGYSYIGICSPRSGCALGELLQAYNFHNLSRTPGP